MCWTTPQSKLRTRHGVYCYPMTVADLYNRYLLACHGLYETTTEQAKPVFERLFREHGLPAAVLVSVNATDVVES